MRSKLFSLLFVVLFSSAGFGQSGSYTFVAIDVPLPGATSTKAFRINARGDIVGRYKDSSDIPHGFLRSADGTFTAPIDVPAATNGTVARGINARGDIVGRYFDSAGSHGFLLTNDGFTTFDVPFALPGSTVAEQINNLGQIVGHCLILSSVPGLPDPIPVPHGFLRHPGGRFTRIDPPGGIASFAHGINDQGTIVGTYLVPVLGTLAAHGFSRTVGGQYATVDAPAAFNTGIKANNDADAVVGFYITTALTVEDLISDNVLPAQGFLLNGHGTFTTIDVSFPGVTVLSSNPLGINPRGTIVGVYVDGSFKEHGFLAKR